MKSKYSIWLKGGLMGLAVMFGFSACSDDHFDVSPSTATTTLWENIESNPKLTDFKKILEKTVVSKDELDTKGTITYKDLLSSPQTFTVWAPEDGTYDANAWLDLLSGVQSMATYSQDYLEKSKIVEKQFVRNHLARYNYSGANGDSVRVPMLNSKVNIYSPIDETFRGVKIDGKTVPSSNGSLHLLEGQAQYVHNLYESIEFTENLDSLYNFLHEDDTLIFLASASTPGATVNGEIQYVDSSFYRSNTVVGNLALWKNEDSLLLGVVPTNTAWDEAKEKVSTYYNYKSSYPYKEDFSSKTLYTTLNPDSMSDTQVKSAILNNIVVSLGKQPGYDVNKTSLEYVKDFVNNTDSIVRGGANNLSNPNIAGDYFRQVVEGVEPYEVSNGYVYPITSYNYVPSKFWHTTIRVEAENTVYQDVNNFSSAKRYGNYYGYTTRLTTLNRNDSIVGTVSNNSYRVFEGTTTATMPTVSFKLPNVKSGTYDIYAVMVPENMDRSDVAIADAKRNRFSATLTYDYNNTNGRAITMDAINAEDGTKFFETKAGIVDTVQLFSNFKFEYAFDGVPYAYPTLLLKSVIRTKDQQAQFTPYLYIDCILLVSRDDE